MHCSKLLRMTIGRSKSPAALGRHSSSRSALGVKRPLNQPGIEILKDRSRPEADIHYNIHGLDDALTQLTGWDFRGGSLIKHSLLFFKR